MMVHVHFRAGEKCKGLPLWSNVRVSRDVGIGGADAMVWIFFGDSAVASSWRWPPVMLDPVGEVYLIGKRLGRRKMEEIIRDGVVLISTSEPRVSLD